MDLLYRGRPTTCGHHQPPVNNAATHSSAMRYKMFSVYEQHGNQLCLAHDTEIRTVEKDKENETTAQFTLHSARRVRCLVM